MRQHRFMSGLIPIPIIKFPGGPILITERVHSVGIFAKVIPSMATFINNIVITIKISIRDVILPHSMPNLFDWI